VVKYTLIVFKDKLHYFFTVWVTRNYENEKKTHFEYGLLHIYTHHYNKF
jgi:hypothetical protein